MTLDERIQHLEAEKRSCMQHFNAAIDNLWNLKKDAENLAEEEAVPAGSRFRPIPVKGKPVSQMIIEDRGSY